MGASTVVKYVAGLALLGTAIGFGLLFKEVRKEPAVESAKAHYEQKEREFGKLGETFSNELNQVRSEQSNLVALATAEKEAALSNDFNLKFASLSNNYAADRAALTERAQKFHEFRKKKSEELDAREAFLQERYYGSIDSITESNAISLTPLERHFYFKDKFKDLLEAGSISSSNVYYDVIYSGIKIKGYNWNVQVTDSSNNVVAQRFDFIIRENPADSALLSANLYVDNSPARSLKFIGNGAIYLDHIDRRIYRLENDKVLFRARNGDAYDRATAGASNLFREVTSLWGRGPYPNQDATISTTNSSAISTNMPILSDDKNFDL